MITRIDRVRRVVGMASCLVLLTLSGRVRAIDAPSDRATIPLRVLIFSGGGQGEQRKNTLILRRILEETGRFDVRLCEVPAGLTPQSLADTDLLVDDSTGQPPGKDTEATIAGFVASGKGLVVTHGALSRTRKGPEDRKEADRDVPEYWPIRPTGQPLQPAGFFDVKVAQSGHPIVRGMKESFRIADALPRGAGILPSAELILAAVVDAKEEPALVATHFGKGRVVSLAIGHDAAAMHEKAFIACFARACEWAATDVVTLPADLTPASPVASSVKGLLITGGHDHEAAFYSIFDGYPECETLPILTSASAFKADLRGKYNVVIMYDFSRDLDEAGKKNLRDYVESGGGVVVLHHALLNYQDWGWWDDEAVGGSYRLTKPSSSVKNDQQFFVSPVVDHPVTAAIAPFHIQDEAYKNMRMSPKIRPLLTTDNPTSDKILAWVGPHDGYRVVAIQLGHGRTAFDHPSYRALVHNAVLWAAGKYRSGP